MERKIPRIDINEFMKYLDKRMEAANKIEDEIRSSKEYICWLIELLKEKEHVDDYQIQYREDKFDKTTYENICNLDHFYCIIMKYWNKYKIPPTYIDYKFRAPVYRVFYEDFYFDICKVSYLEGYVTVQSTGGYKKAINYKDIMEDKEPKGYNEKDEFIKEFQKRIRDYKKRAKELDIDMEYLKEIVEEEFDDEKI